MIPTWESWCSIITLWFVEPQRRKSLGHTLGSEPEGPDSRPSSAGLDGASAELGEGDQSDGGRLLNASDLSFFISEVGIHETQLPGWDVEVSYWIACRWSSRVQIPLTGPH